MFERTLQDVVKGLRAQPTSEGRTEFASMVLQECKKELPSTDGTIKANAVLKVSHLRMLGYDDRNCGDDDTSFHVIETMASQPFKQKRIGYLAAATILTTDSPVLLLATNSLKKEFQSTEMYVVGLALGSTSNFVSRELARDLLPDVILVATTAIKPYCRKRGTLCLYRLCMRYPEGLREGAYDALRSRLDDSDNSVVSCAVNAVCELAKANPRNVLPLTPQLFQLLTGSGNNWLTIKVVKLYSSLVNVEPRLAKKILDPLAHIIKTTAAKSLLFECISTTTKALRHAMVNDADSKGKIEQVVHLCAVKLKEFIRDADQNLKYLGLVGFVELTKSFPYVAQEHKDLVLLCLNDEDVTVRLRALELLAGMANQTTISGIISRLLEHLSKAPPGKFRDAVVQTCIDACVEEEFQRVPSFEWLVAVLMDLARLGKGAHGPLLAKQIVHVAMRVQSVREFAASACIRLLFETADEGFGRDVEEGSSGVAPDILAACSFVACEYFTENASKNDQTLGNIQNLPIKLVETLLADENALRLECSDVCRAQLENNQVENSTENGKKSHHHNHHHRRRIHSKLPPEARCIFILNAFKLAIKCSCEDVAMQESEKWLSSSSFRVRERTNWCREWSKSGKKSFVLESEPLGPIHKLSQRRVPVPLNLDLSVRKGKERPTMSSTKRIVSFRGKSSQGYYSYGGASSENPHSSKPVTETLKAFSPFQVQDPTAFLLGPATVDEKESNGKKRKGGKKAAKVNGDVDMEHSDSLDSERATPSKLWSSDVLLKNTAPDSKNVFLSPPFIVMAPTRVPANFDETEKHDEIPLRKPSGVLTLADIDILDDSPAVMASLQVEKTSGSSNLASPNGKEEKKKKKKKKSKKELVAGDDHAASLDSKLRVKGGDTSTKTQARQKEQATIQNEADLLDFSEM